MSSTRWQTRADSGDWDAIAAQISAHGGALLPRLLTAAEAARLRTLYAQDDLFRKTVDMESHRYGAGEYRNFRQPYPEPLEQLKHALYPRLLTIARDWWAKLGRDSPWPDTLDEWLQMCHAAGQTKPTALLLRYRAGDWNALHRDLYGDLVFPLQVVINLSDPATDYTGGEFLLVEQRHRHAGPPGALGSRVVGRTGTARHLGGAFGGTLRVGTDLSRRRLNRWVLPAAGTAPRNPPRSNTVLNFSSEPLD